MPVRPFLCELALRCHSTHCVNPSRTYGFVWSAATSVVAVTSADMPTSTLRKRNIHMQCSSQTTASGTMLEVCTYMWDLTQIITWVNGIKNSFGREMCSNVVWPAGGTFKFNISSASQMLKYGLKRPEYTPVVLKLWLNDCVIIF